MIPLVILVAAFVVTALRWLRVAQREHYVAGSVVRFAVRWWTSSTTNVVAFVAAAFFVFLSRGFIYSSLGAVLILVATPWGFSLRGRTSRLDWTRRLRSLAGVAFGLDVVPIGVTAAFDVRVAGELAGVLLLFCPVVVDLAVALTAPIERRLGRRFVTRASERLAAVDPLVVAVTGSYGKTTTKGYVAHLLEGAHHVLASPRSFNNLQGLSRSVNEHLEDAVDVFVAEMGAYGRGEIAELCRAFPPDIAVITAIGPVHLERFGSLEVTLAAKAEITEDARDVVVNVDDERLAGLAKRLCDDGKHVLRASAKDRDADACAQIDEGFISLYSHGRLVGRCERLVGQRYIVLTNLACAVAAAMAAGADVDSLASRIATIPQPPNRLVLTEAASGAFILDDTFNANPAGAELALARLEELSREGHRTVLVTPGMVELGREQAGENTQLAMRAAAICSDVVVVGRTNRRALCRGARDVTHCVIAANRDEAVAWVKSNLGAGDVVLYENDLPDHYA